MKKLRNVISVIILMICVILLLFIPLPRLGNLKLNIWCLVSTIIFGAVFDIIMCGEFYFIAISSSIKNGMSFIFVAFLPLLLSARVLLENLKQFEHRKMVDKIIDRER